MDSPYDDHPPHSLPPPAHLSHLSRNLSGLSVNPASSAPGSHGHHPERPFGLRISTSVSNPSSHNPSPSVPPSRKRSFTSNHPPSLPSLSTTVMGTAGSMVSGSATPLLEEDIPRSMDLDLDYDKYDKYHEPKYEKYDPDAPPNSALTSAPPSALPMSAADSRGSITPSGGTSPIDGGGSGSGGSGEEGNMNSVLGTGRIGSSHGNAGMGLLGKPMPTNNFVTKLYQ
ncbi:hypothetical protein GYMLUDRAFT_61613 [Collybiopsis luxurians FD-317 M1]|uniref:Unplaced genomic scaffold GYMLUscaffold_45, whole genome shotgun sequence n=1 Tax=Collybiopsis luxurians FD-317 M1 TaxID=944289 RepID=A0A0D0B1P5_9AGAR|nr:hypothetical protein GYMLUDRAFT_61613 [Collybiopsis luxurians FD-317 M1]